MGVFDAKFFNSEVFGKYMETVPRLKQTALLKAGVLNVRNDLKPLLAEQTGGNFITVPMIGRIGGAPSNYDGATDIGSGSINGYAQSMIVVGRARGWHEHDFTYDVTGHDFMGDIGKQVAEYWDDVDQTTMLCILEGIFSMTTGGNNFATDHTLDISATSGADVVDATTLNNAMQKAGAANKNMFSAVIMHSTISTNLENLKLLQYVKGTDADGMQKDMALGTWNGRIVLIDDDVPVTEAGVYTTYVLGRGAFDYVDCGAKVPYEMARDAKTDGGIDTLYTRQRKVFAPRGISFNQPSVPIVSPTDDQLKSGANWRMVTDGTKAGFFPSKAIPIAQIKSKG